MVKSFIITMLLAGCISEVDPAYSKSTDSFQMFEYLIFTNTPDLSTYGLKHIPEMGPRLQYWKEGDDPYVDFPDERTVRDIAVSKPSSLDQDIYYFDIEHLPTGVNKTKLEWSESIVKLSAIASWFKSERPNIKVGFYEVMPKREYWVHNRNQRWKDRNTYFKPLSEYIDFVSPSLYTFYENQQGWVEYAIDNIKEARKYGKPVYPFIWPQYHDSSVLAGQLIPGDYWRLQLDTLKKYADGVIIWGGWRVDWSESTSETDPNNWWYQTLDFMRQKGL